MAVHFKYSRDFIIGGPAKAQLTPSFQLREYARPDGTVNVHRELVGSVQVLRDAVGMPLKIVSMVPADGLGAGLEGRFVWVSGAKPAEVVKSAARLAQEGHFLRVEARGEGIYLEMPDPAALPAVRPELAIANALRVTAAFETSGDPFQQVTGNFDGAGLSFGPLQVNLKTGTLQALFARFAACNGPALQAGFGGLWPEWQAMLRLPSRARQIAWADALSRGGRKTDFEPAWKAALQAVGRTPDFHAETLRYAYDIYGRKLIAALSWLHGLKPIRVDNLRCLASLYDLCVQQGSLDKARDAIRSRVGRENPTDQFQLTRIAVEERGKTALPQWRADCVSRRLCILEREPVAVSLNGQSAERENPQLYLLRNAPVSRIEQYLL